MPLRLLHVTQSTLRRKICSAPVFTIPASPHKNRTNRSLVGCNAPCESEYSGDRGFDRLAGMGHMSKPTQYTRPAERLGAHLALLLNMPASPDRVRINTFDLWRRLTRTISRNERYRFPLLGCRTVDTERSDQAAIAWFDLVLDGDRQVHAGRAHHNGHELLVQLCNRSTDVAPAILSRTGVSMLPKCPNQPVKDVSERLQTLAERCEAKPHKDGPLHLMLADAQACEVPESLSLWAGIRCASPDLDLLDDDQELQFIYFMARALHGANKHWEMLAQLGLHPPDWINQSEDGPLATLTTNQARLALKYVKFARSLSGDAQHPTPDNWNAAWQAHPITKSLSFQQFRDTKVGQSLLSPDVTPYFVSNADIENIADPATDEPIASSQDALEMLKTLQQSGDVPQKDIELVSDVLAGETLASIYENDPAYKERFPDFDDFLDHSDKVGEKIAGTVEDRLSRDKS